MIKVKIKCEKYYGTMKNWVDADFIDTKILNQIIEKYTFNNILEITEEIVDFYNKEKSRKNRSSHKTANALATQIRKLIKNRELAIDNYII